MEEQNEIQSDVSKLDPSDSTSYDNSSEIYPTDPNSLTPGIGSTSGGDFSSFNMTNATYGRSESGRKTLLDTTIAQSINNIKKTINGDQYNKLKTTVRDNWVGVDADQFLANIEKTRKEVEEVIDSLKVQLSLAIDDEAKEFAQFQQDTSASVGINN